jgi:hypothetical protein
MKLDEVMQMIDELIAHHEMFIGEDSTYYHDGAVDALEELRDAIKQKGGAE